MTKVETSQADALRAELWQEPAPPESEAKFDLRTRAWNSLRGAREFLFSSQREELFWCAELESNTTITAEYVFLYQMLGLGLSDRKEKIMRYLRNQQKADGSWGIATTSAGDVSTTAEAYLALRILGQNATDPNLQKAETFILQHGGLEELRIFTRIFFAMFGLIPWNAIPALPPEFVLLPPQSPINIYSLASWARGTMIPLFVIFHHRPVFALPNGKFSQNDWLDHLWINSADKEVPYMPPWWRLLLQKGCSYEVLFGTADLALKFYEPYCLKPVRKRALEKCMNYILEHQEETGDWGGIFPPMINGVLALVLQGYALDSRPVQRGLRAIESFSWEDSRGLRIQACVSPTWDTALSLIALLDSGARPQDARLQGAIRWLEEKQLIENHGDWRVYRPDLPPGGWSFEYSNTWYPDVDDTAAVLLALIKQNPDNILRDPFQRAIHWVLGMQNRDGGWAAFDVNNDKIYLNKIPFSDMDSLCDTSCPDITGRILESFGLYLSTSIKHQIQIDLELEKQVRAACERGIAYLRRTQEKNGSWFGRWGVNYVYGTSNALCGLAQVNIPAEDPMVAKALTWLNKIQNRNGGWGECVSSYKTKSYVPRDSTASQTAWALMGQLGYLDPTTPSITRGIEWLIENQVQAPRETSLEGGKRLPQPGGDTWLEDEPTGTGFPQHFYLNYHLYRHYFPMMALGRFLGAQAGE